MSEGKAYLISKVGFCFVYDLLFLLLAMYHSLIVIFSSVPLASFIFHLSAFLLKRETSLEYPVKYVQIKRRPLNMKDELYPANYFQFL